MLTCKFSSNEIDYKNKNICNMQSQYQYVNFVFKFNLSKEYNSGLGIYFKLYVYKYLLKVMLDK